ncbi:hypothetical protein BC829DRAFT_303106 [Chytridium lagenaria]|nr:hypothetical protein BC829DRAFT_303106 [Chytridium lagenaria]
MNSNDTKKYEETIKKLGDLYEKLRDIESAMATFGCLSSIYNQPSPENLQFWRRLISVQIEWDQSSISKSIDNWKRRLDYKGLEATTFMVEKEILLKSKVDELSANALNCISDTSDADGLIIRDILVNFLWKKSSLLIQAPENLYGHPYMSTPWCF